MLARDNTLNNKFFKNNDNGKFTFISNNPEKTVCLGIELGNLLQAGDLIAINGALGAGKTSLIKGIVKGLKSPDIVTSPTFSIINEYSSTVPIFHFDLYRINKLEDIEELGYEEYFAFCYCGVVRYAHTGCIAWNTSFCTKDRRNCPLENAQQCGAAILVDSAKCAC